MNRVACEYQYNLNMNHSSMPTYRHNPFAITLNSDLL